jgi:hypothetical protein
MKRLALALLLLAVGAVAGGWFTAHTIMMNASITGTPGAYTVEVFGQTFLYE